MNESRLMQQVTAIFSVFMVFFYLGIGVFLISYSELINVDKAVRVIMGSVFLFYGIYRAFRAWEKIKEAYFTKNNRDSDRDKHHNNGRIGHYE